jgi:hypothetical protein
VVLPLLPSCGRLGARKGIRPVENNASQLPMKSQLNTISNLHRLQRRDEVRGAPTGGLQARGEKLTTAAQTSTTSLAFGKRAGIRECSKLRIGSVNVGTMCGRSGEVVDMAARRKLDFCCLQETRWKGGSARMIGGAHTCCTFFWSGCEEGTAGAGFWWQKSGLIR